MTKALEEKFETYDEANPHIYDLFYRFAKETLDRGYSHYSANAIFERIRWYVDIETEGDQLKVNNNYRPYYARKLMESHQEFSSFFRVRELQE